MKNGKDFNIGDIFEDERYKSTAMFILYVVIFVGLIILVRFNGTSSNNENKEKKPNDTPTEQVEDNDGIINYDFMSHSIDDENNDRSIYNMFSFIRANNYAFTYDINIGKEVTITGERYDNKYKFTVDNKADNTQLEYLSKGGDTRVVLNGKYENAEFPVVYIDYFDNVILYNILKNSKKVEDTEKEIKYTITNAKLEPFILDDYVSALDSNNKDENEITVHLDNNKIIGIDFLLNNVSYEEIDSNEIKITIKYEKFTQIANFNVDFGSK